MTAAPSVRSEPDAFGALGLRARVTVAFALGALALSAVLSLATYTVVKTQLVAQQERAAASQTYLNARVLRDGLRGGASVGEVLTNLQTPDRGGVVLRREERWYANSVIVGRDTLPVALRDGVAAGGAATQRFKAGGESWVAVGVPIPRFEAQFFEVFSLNEVDRTLETLGYSLGAVAVVTALAGAAVGRWASGRVLRPLGGVSDAAAAIAGGQLDIRLGARDRDLAPLAASFNHMVDALSERIDRDARFASDVSHELRSPLTTLSTAVEVLEGRRGELSARGREALDLLGADVRRFQRMVEDLLEISRFDAGMAELDLQEVDLAELARHAVRGTGESVPVVVRGGGQVVPAEVDKRRMERVIVNLITNARSYGGGATTIEVGEVEGAVRLEVVDHGPGVPLEERRQIFDRFFRGSAAGRRGAGSGSGLGLALVVEHVRLHGGRVWVEDGNGARGARFIVEVPRPW